MKDLSLFIELTRLNKPIGCMLLFWPCLWGLTLSYDFRIGPLNFIVYSVLFFFGSILMRSAGCIVNDISDKNFDKKVLRTKNRPIASGKISTEIALLYTIILCFIAFLILLNFNKLTIILALASMPLAFTYPLMKRYTYWPQMFLGVTFNYGIILGWTSINNHLSIAPLILYIGAIFWTLGYDTIYGFQDIKDDEIIGVKSTSIKFKKKPKKFLYLCYLVFIVCMTILGLHMNFNLIYFLFLLILIIQLLFFQVKKLKINSPSNCLSTFKANNVIGLICFITILVGKTSL